MIFSNAQGTKHRPPQSPESPVSSWLHGVERGLNLWKRSEAAQGPVVGEEWSTQQVGRKSSNRRLAAALEASDQDEDRPFRPRLIVPPNPRSRKRALVRPPIWSRGNSWGRNQPTSEVSSSSGRGVPSITVASKTVTTYADSSPFG